MHSCEGWEFQLQHEVTLPHLYLFTTGQSGEIQGWPHKNWPHLRRNRGDRIQHANIWLYTQSQWGSQLTLMVFLLCWLVVRRLGAFLRWTLRRKSNLTACCDILSWNWSKSWQRLDSLRLLWFSWTSDKHLKLKCITLLCCLACAKKFKKNK